MTGYGSYTFNDGTKITGYFENGVCNKHGKKVYPDGRIYIGEFRNDIENGKGVLIWGDRKISGIWKDAQLVQELIQQTVNNNSKSDQMALSLLMQNRPDSVAESMGIDVLDMTKLNAQTPDEVVEEENEETQEDRTGTSAKKFDDARTEDTKMDPNHSSTSSPPARNAMADYSAK